MRNPNNPSNASTRAAAADGATGVVGDATSLAAMKRFLAEFKRLKAHVYGAALREQVAQISMSTMTAYLAGELPAEDAAQIEEFLRTEPLLRETYAGLVAAWQAPNAERAVTTDEVDASYTRFKAMVAAKGGTPKR